MVLEYEEIDLGQVDGTDGTNGREIEMQVSSTHVQLRYKGETAWKNIIALSSITGEQGIPGINGKKLMLQKTSTHLQYKYEGETVWTNLIALTDITGPQGLQGTSIRLKGAWVSGTAYVNNTSFIDNVTYGGETYGCIKSHTATASILPTNTTYWIRLTEKGATGTQGIPGIAGKDGNAKIANNLTTSDATYALSAAQGKALKEMVDGIEPPLRKLGISDLYIFAYDGTTRYYAGTYKQRAGSLDVVGDRVFIDFYLQLSALGDISKASDAATIYIQVASLPDFATSQSSNIAMFNLALPSSFNQLAINLQRIDGTPYIQLVKFCGTGYNALTKADILATSYFAGGINYRRTT